MRVIFDPEINLMTSVLVEASMRVLSTLKEPKIFCAEPVSSLVMVEPETVMPSPAESEVRPVEDMVFPVTVIDPVPFKVTSPFNP